jgi:prepilin-type N-terminal cleavage/methylation domain-containing protein
MSAQQTSKSDGFTIVEMIIVLAVAGLILLMVLVAIPALQRGSRNNQRKQDVQVILEAVSHWELNNSGNIPTPTDNYLQASNAKLTYYDPLNVYINGGSSGWSPAPNPVTATPDVEVYNYQKCSATSLGSSTAAGAGYSDIVALYTIETAGGTTPKCQQL